MTHYYFCLKFMNSLHENMSGSWAHSQTRVEGFLVNGFTLERENRVTVTESTWP